MPAARYAYFGPRGTFTEAALRTLPHDPGAELAPYPSVPAALEAVRAGDAAAAMVPIENSVEGGVPATLDELANGEPLVVTREVLLPVRFALMARPGTRLEDVRSFGTFPHAEAQCRKWVAENLPRATYQTAASTAAAAEAIASGTATYDAALSAPIAAATYGLDVLADGLGDNPHAVTRFVLVSRPVPPPLPTGADRTSIVLFIREDHPGALLEILTELAVRGVNLTRIESRPTGQGLGRYLFSIDCEGHVDEAAVGEALMGLRRVCAETRYLGSYPRAEASPAPASTSSDSAFREAQAWLARVRERGNG
ncbi:prephenate dehydratase [Motilibacter aurantiacus]|uniref:prephenate dehydratase n=1 Tax=Motilibacter aurantiacus TaxID=2714955 RepID=UPI00140A7B2F|nr:prephenate dehydratase [Motilibacter aurantiacus]NHC46326.1 prephenate dehydratase [Motilibacter aurantiacus]